MTDAEIKNIANIFWTQFLFRVYLPISIGVLVGMAILRCLR